MATTKIISVVGNQIDAAISEADETLRRGGLVAFPTETVYGLGADALNEHAVKKVFEAKGRPADNPLIVHIAEFNQLQDLAGDIPTIARPLAERFWPGPLTLVVKHNGTLPKNVTAGLSTVAVRVPNHPVTLRLIKKFGSGIVGPSANLSGKPSPTKAKHVYDDLKGKVDIILDAGPTTIGVESTVLDVTTTPPTILRLGGLPRETIEKLIGSVQTSTSDELLKRSPGTRHRHYAPDASVILIEEGNVAAFQKTLNDYTRQRKKFACIVHSKMLLDAGSSKNIIFISTDEYAQKIFDALRTCDEKSIDVILVEEIPAEGIGAAAMDRLRKAEKKDNL